MRIHTISRESGKVRVWDLPMAFFTYPEGNACDTEGGSGEWPYGAVSLLFKVHISPSLFKVWV